MYRLLCLRYFSCAFKRSPLLLTLTLFFPTAFFLHGSPAVAFPLSQVSFVPPGEVSTAL